MHSIEHSKFNYSSSYVFHAVASVEYNRWQNYIEKYLRVERSLLKISKKP